jgi:S1-C subfamily serine protease
VLALPQGTGSGFIISGRRILTNAHNVANQNWVIVQRHGIPKKYPATVVAVGHECDLALISVEDDDFWVGTVALEFGQVPELQMSVVVVGFPTGGDNLCVTAGVVSRVDVHEYAHSGFSLLCVQIDAAVNAGNSGGPALCDDSSKVIGVAFQGREDAENVGYIIPSSVVHHFLSDIERNGVYSGFVTLGVTWSPLENCHLRAYVGIDSCELPEGLARSGVVVCKVDKTRHDPEVLQAGDTLLAVDGVSIADDSTIQFRVMERLPFAHLILQKHVGDPCEITILRDRKVTKRTVVLQSPKYLVPECVYDELPRYYICGGMVFVPLTLTYMLHEFGKRYYEKAPNVLLGAIDERFRSREGEEVVIFSQVYISAGIELRPKI